jgi:hypothetical protein
LASLVTLVAIAVLYLNPYVTEGFRYPLGWDAMTYISRSSAVTFDGLERLGAVRAGGPLVVAILMSTTRENSLTLLAVLPVVLAGTVSLAGAALVRAGLGIRLVWVPVIGILTWTAFGFNGMLNVHLDNLLNAALVLSAFAAAVASFSHGRGAVAVALLLAAAGLAHWPFYTIAVLVLGSAVVLAAGWVPGPWRRQSLPAAPARRILLAAAASAAVTGATFLFPAASGWRGVRLFRLADELRLRFLRRIGEEYRYPTIVLGVLGAVGAARAPCPPAREPARRVFLWLMASWGILTAVGMVAQAAGLPAAGARLLFYLFPATLLTGVAVWWLAGRIRAALGPGLGIALASLLTFLLVASFWTLAWGLQAGRRPVMAPIVVRQASAAGAYVAGFAPGRDVVYVFPRALGGQAWHTIKATLPPNQVPRSRYYVGLLDDFLAGKPSTTIGADTWDPERADSSQPLIVLLARYNQRDYAEVAQGGLGTEVAPGVAVVGGPVPAAPLDLPDPPVAATDPGSLVRVFLLCVMALFLAGAGWTVLLPADLPLRVLLAPALGAAVVTLLAAIWSVAGLPLRGGSGLALVVLSTISGAGLALTLRLRPMEAVS